MKGILTVCCAKPLAIYLAAALIAVSTVGGPAEAMFLPAASQAPATPLFDRAADLATIQKALEAKTIRQRLMDYGLSSGETLEKVNGLSDGQISRLAANIDALQAGGHALDSHDLLIILLLVLLIVILVENRTSVPAGWTG
jgi:hypothetical protein